MAATSCFRPEAAVRLSPKPNFRDSDYAASGCVTKAAHRRRQVARLERLLGISLEDIGE